jgi:hypothetical protein
MQLLNTTSNTGWNREKREEIRRKVGDLFLWKQSLWKQIDPMFPDLFLIASSRDAWVEESMQRQNGTILWNILFTRPVLDWEVEDVSRFFEMLYSLKVRSEGEDKMCWIPA